jgi:hypothetical protein
MPPSTTRVYLVGKMGSYEVPTLARVDSCLRELRHRLVASGPQMLPRIWADVDALLERRSQLTVKIDT